MLDFFQQAPMRASLGSENQSPTPDIMLPAFGKPEGSGSRQRSSSEPQ